MYIHISEKYTTITQHPNLIHKLRKTYQYFTMLGTRNEAIDAYFNGDDWSLQNDIMLMSFLRRRASPHPTLSSMNVFDEVIKQVQIDLDRVLPNDVTLLDVKIRIRALCSWFYDFKEYIAESGVHFNRQDMTVTVDHTQYAEPQHVGQSRNTYKVILLYRYIHMH